MTRADWEHTGGPLGTFLNGDAIRSVDAHAQPVHDNSLLLLFNAADAAVDFVLPPRRFGLRWDVEISTAAPDEPSRRFAAREAVPVAPWSMVVLTRTR
jgi:glycogen operon protein